MVVRSTVQATTSATSKVTTGSGGGAAGGTPALDIRAHVGTSTSPTSIGTKEVTGVGFRPEVFLPFGALLAAGGVTPGATLSLGAATASAQGSVSASAQQGLTTSNTDRRHTNAATITQLASNGVLFEEANLVSFGADKVSLNWTTANATAYILNHIALGGTNLEVSLTQHQMNGTNDPQSFAHGLTGGAPTALILMTAGQTTVPPQTDVDAQLSILYYAAATNIGVSIRSKNARSTTLCARLLSHSLPTQWGSAVNGINRAIAVNSVDSSNVNCSYPTAVGTAQAYFWMLAIRGAKAQVGTFDCNGSTSPLTIATPGITPKLFLPVFISTGVSSAGTVLNDLCLSIGASDGTNNLSCGITDQNGVTTTNARRFQSSTSLCEYNTAGTKSFEATAAFSGESVVVTPTTAAANFGQAGYLVLGS